MKMFAINCTVLEPGRLFWKRQQSVATGVSSGGDALAKWQSASVTADFMKFLIQISPEKDIVTPIVLANLVQRFPVEMPTWRY
jgi:hypothetical protein